MSLYQQAASLNNEGIIALLEGDQSSAISSMAKAIKLMKTELSSLDASRMSCSNNSTNSGTEQSTQTVEIPVMESSNTMVFNQAFRLPMDVELPNELNINVFSCAIIFNLALIYHFQADSGDAMLMTKTEKLYSMVLKLLDNNSLSLRTALIVKLACINNLSQIRYAKGDYKNAREGLRQVSCVMRQSSNQAMFEEPQIQGLLMNVLLLKAPKVAAAA
jgi:hypothetical protein